MKRLIIGLSIIGSVIAFILFKAISSLMGIYQDTSYQEGLFNPIWGILSQTIIGPIVIFFAILIIVIAIIESKK